MQTVMAAGPQPSCVRKTRVAVLLMLALYGAGKVSAQTAQTAQELLAQARAEHAAGHRVEALAYCQELLARWPDNREARQLDIQWLSELGAAARARELAGAAAASTHDAGHAGLLSDYAAHETRWAQGEPDDLHHPYVEADRAVTHLRQVADDPHASASLRRRARIDLLVALQRAGRAAEAVALYKTLQQQRVTLPPYAQRAAAAAFMQQHKPRTAAVLYEDSIRRDPGPYDVNEPDPRIALAKAYMDGGQPRKALALIDQLAKAEPRWLHVAGVRAGIENTRKLDADTASAALRDSADLLADAHARLLALSDQAPGNPQLLRELALAQFARGWPYQALDTLQMADTLDQGDVGGMLSKAEIYRYQHDYTATQAQLDQAAQQAWRDDRVTDALGAWQRERGWQFDLTHDNGRGNSPDFGDRDQETQATLASPLIDDHWRMLALARTASASLQEGQVSRHRAGLGVQAYWPGLVLYVQALPALDRYARRSAFETGFTWSMSDHWSLTSDWSSASADIPLRAQYYGITGKTFDTAIQWRASELTSARLVLTQDRFSDGNLRKSWLLDGVQRLHTGADVAIDGGVEIGGSSNSETDRPYFNPRQDRSYAFTGSIKSLLSQDHDRVWNQSFDVALGQYAERNYPTGWMVSARYGQTFQPQAGLRVGWGLGWHWQPYDGRHESRVVLDLALHWGE